MEQKPVRIGVIGAGRIGKIHAGNLASRIPGAQLAAIADVNAQAAQALADSLHVPVAAGYEAIMQDPSLDAVAICSSTDTHARFIAEAAAAGKHIFCEKPIDFDLARIDRTLEAVAKAGVKLQIGFNRRFDPNFHRIREMITAGQIGDPYILRITSRDPEPPPIDYVRVSGGMFLDMTIHDFDMARYQMGCEVQEVFVAGTCLIDSRICEEDSLDTAITTLRFENGALGTIDNSMKAVYGYDQRLEVLGSKGMAAAANNTPDNVVYSNADAIHSAKPLYFFLERYVESFIAEMKAFVACVRNDTPPPVTGHDGRMAVVIGMAAYKSYLENRPVKITEIAAY